MLLVDKLVLCLSPLALWKTQACRFPKGVESMTRNAIMIDPLLADKPLLWQDCAMQERRLPRWLPSFLGFRYRWNDAREWADQILKARHRLGWAPSSDLHKIICQTAEDECGWEHGCFNINDEMRVVFWAFEDGLDTEFAFAAIENRLSMKLSASQVELAMDGTVGQFVGMLESLAITREEGRSLK